MFGINSRGFLNFSPSSIVRIDVPGSKLPQPERQAYSRRGLEELGMEDRWRSHTSPPSSTSTVSTSYSQASSS